MIRAIFAESKMYLLFRVNVYVLLSFNRVNFIGAKFLGGIVKLILS